jgi:hypothetical protein
VMGYSRLFVSSNICYKVKAKAMPPAGPPPLRLVAARYGVPTPPPPAAGKSTGRRGSGGPSAAASSSSQSSWHRAREPSADEEILYTPPQGRYQDDEMLQYEQEGDVADEGFPEEGGVNDEEEELVEVEDEDDEMRDEEGMGEGRVEFEVVDHAAPWAGVPHKGKGKGSGGARIQMDDDGGPFTVVLDMVVCII